MINLSIVAITSCGMSCGAEHSSNRAFVSSGKTAHTAHAVFTHAQQSLILCHSQSMHETQEEQEETQVLQVCLGLGRFGHAFATKELDPYLGDKISNYSIKNSQGRADK